MGQCDQFVRHHKARVICLEVERKAGRGVPMRRDPIRNSLQLKMVAEESLGVQEVRGEVVEPKSLEDILIIGARRILDLQQQIQDTGL